MTHIKTPRAVCHYLSALLLLRNCVSKRARSGGAEHNLGAGAGCVGGGEEENNDGCSF